MPLTLKNQARVAMLEAQDGYGPPNDKTLAIGQDDFDLSVRIEGALAGETLVVADGDYTIGHINDCSEGVTVMAKNKGQVSITGNAGDTISCMDGARLGEITFKGLVIEASERSMVTTLSQKPPYRMNFEDCIFDGSKGGFATGDKWGLNIHRWDGYIARCTVRDIDKEHGGYFHTPAGDCLIYQTRAINNGRTGWQFVGRNNEAGYADVQLAFVQDYFENNGRKDGGSQLTVGGCREVYVENCEWLIDKYRLDGTGHFVNWNDKMRQDPCEMIEFRGTNKMFTAEGCMSAPALTVVNSEWLAVSGRIGIFAGGQKAVVYDSLMPVTLGPWASTPQIQGKVVAV